MFLSTVRSNKADKNDSIIVQGELERIGKKRNVV
jgi:hypothetical protein